MSKKRAEDNLRKFDSSGSIGNMDLLSIEEASQLTKKNPTTIRRLIKKLLQTNKEAKDKIRQEKTVSGFRYKIDKTYLLTYAQPISSPIQESIQQPKHQTSQLPIHQDIQEQKLVDVSLLKAKDETIVKQDETIAILKEQLRQKDEQIREMLKRDGERNILFHKFQDALMLEAPKKNTTSTDIPTQGVTQESVHQPIHQDRQPIQAEQADTITNHQQKGSVERQKKVKPPRKQPQKFTVKTAEQPKNQEKKGLFSWFK
jgi:hypothetical protein